ncbi:MAG: PVC-type heme-binding CxxCH protein [Verrucomicrobiota bacterium]
MNQNPALRMGAHRPLLAALLPPLLLLLHSLAAQDLKKGNSLDAQPRTPAAQLGTFKPAPGFVVELVASEETGLPKPVSIAFDDAGRMWAVTATEYPRDQDPGVWTRPGRDRVVVFDEPLGPGPHAARPFADGMVLPLSVLPMRGGAVVAQGPEILFLSDTNRDGRADSRQVLLRGFGVQDTHTLPHQLEQYPGGWIVFSQGVLNHGTAVTATGREVNFDKTVIAKFRPDGSDLRILGTGLNNIWAWVQDRGGRVFFHEANDFGYSLVPFEEDSSYPSFIKRLVHPDSPYHPPTAPNLSLGGTGFSGLALSDDRSGSFPDPWHQVFFVANPITRTIHCVAGTLGTDGVHRFEQRPDLLTCEDEFFRPVALRFGPDGCLYIVDWYNRIISHNEVDRNHPARDKTRGRVWRVRHQSQTRRTAPNVAAAPTPALLQHLQAASTWEMRAAWHQIQERQATGLIAPLAQLAAAPTQPEDVRIHALWALEGLGHFDPVLWQTLLASPSVNVRHEAVRSLSSVDCPLETAHRLLQPLAAEPTFRVRYAILRHYRDRPEPLSPEQWTWLQRWRTEPDLKNTVKGWDREYLAPGGTYEAAFQNLLLQMVAEKGRPRVHVATSSRWNRVLRPAPPSDPMDRARRQARVASLTRHLATEPASVAGRGAGLFVRNCAACHSTVNDGQGFAPSLAGSRHRTPEAILTSLVDPSQAVETVFRPYQVELLEGDSHTGFLSDESAESLTLRFADATSRAIPFRAIREAGYLDGVSLMPDGLLDAMSPDEIADLVRYVQTLK